MCTKVTGLFYLSYSNKFTGQGVHIFWFQCQTYILYVSFYSYFWQQGIFIFLSNYIPEELCISWMFMIENILKLMYIILQSKERSPHECTII